jgi:hypothetical protein
MLYIALVKGHPEIIFCYSSSVSVEFLDGTSEPLIIFIMRIQMCRFCVDHPSL